MRKRKDERILKPVRPNLGLGAAYRKRLDALIEEMTTSYAHWLRAQYRANPPRLAADATPAAELRAELRKLGTQWEKRFDEAAPKLAKYFSTAVWKRSDRVLHKILRDAGISVKFQMTPAMRDVLEATIAGNVSMIKSISSHYHTEIEGAVMRSVTAGRDLHSLTKELESRYGITRRRASFIASTQNAMATASMTRVRQQEAGIEEAIWLHSHAGREPRKTHLANDGKRYKVAEGWFDPDPKVLRRIWPGELPRCRCTPKPIVRGFT
jgi:SPP1 gp7 family putative phage head morphogenesis protein